MGCRGGVSGHRARADDRGGRADTETVYGQLGGSGIMSVQATVSVPLYQSFEDLVCRVLDYETRDQVGPDHEIGIIDGDGLASFEISEPPTLLGDFRYMISHPGTTIEIKSGRFRRVLGS